MRDGAPLGEGGAVLRIEREVVEELRHVLLRLFGRRAAQHVDQALGDLALVRGVVLHHRGERAGRLRLGHRSAGLEESDQRADAARIGDGHPILRVARQAVQRARGRLLRARVAVGEQRHEWHDAALLGD